MKPILKLVNVFPLFLGLLIIGTAWKLFWATLVVPRVSPSGVWAKIAGAALVQWGAG